jgi:CubicO group peptidase (beta-lactamase class C family)
MRNYRKSRFWGDCSAADCYGREAATFPQINVSGFTSFFYGYFFWLGRSLSDRREVRWTAAVGLGGQRLFVVPTLDLVVVINAGLYKGSLQCVVPTSILNQYVLKAAASHP